LRLPHELIEYYRGNPQRFSMKLQHHNKLKAYHKNPFSHKFVVLPGTYKHSSLFFGQHNKDRWALGQTKPIFRGPMYRMA